MRRWHTLVIAFTLLCQSVMAQETGSVSGTVTQPNAETLPGVLVVAAGNALATPVTTTTSASGQYALPRVPPGEYVITFSLAERGTEKRTVQVRGQQDSVIDLVMQLRFLQEVVVTARKVPENLQAVPVAITALGRESLAHSGAANIAEINRYSPNTTLDFTAGLSGASSVLTAFIRGIGQADFATNFEPGVGFYVDDVYYARTVGSVIDLLDIDRIEVLRGPQGTLFGRNTSGGAIRVVTRDPGDHFRLAGDVTAGSWNRLNVRTAVDGPIAHSLSGSFAMSVKSASGWGEVIRFPGPTASDITEPGVGEQGDENDRTLRAKLLWRPATALTFSLSGESARVRGAGPLVRNVQIDSKTGVISTLYNGCLAGLAPPPACTLGPERQSIFGVNVDADPTNDRTPFQAAFVSPANRNQSYASSIDSYNDIDTHGFSVVSDWAASRSFVLKSITAYRNLDADFASNTSGTPLAMGNSRFLMKSSQLSEEVRLTGPGAHGVVNWLTGLYLFKEDGETTDIATLGSGLGSVRGPARTETTSYAAFGQVGYDITRKVGLTAGLRYTHENKTFQTDFRDLSTLAYELGEAGVPGLLERALADGDPQLNYPAQQDGKTFDHVDPRVGMEYRPREGTLAYVSYAGGYKSGGWSSRTILPLLNFADYDAETVFTFEAGVKKQWQKLRANAALFHTHANDFQLVVVAETVAPVVESSGGAEMYGAEFEFDARPTGAMAISGSVGYLHSAYTSTPPNSLVQKAFRLIDAPAWQSNVSLAYTWPVGRAGLSAYVDHSYVSTHANDALNTPALIEDGYHDVHVAVGYRPAGGKWELVSGIRNAFDERRVVTGFANLAGLGFVNEVVNMPRNWYTTLRVFF